MDIIEKNNEIPEKIYVPKHKASKFFSKYFMEGQNSKKSLADDEKPYFKSRKFIGTILPIIFFETIWFLLAFKKNYFAFFPERYLLSITMVFGATIAGMTSEGGGAVAFPVMTLILNVSPFVARDVSIMIQSIGMTAASFTIIWMKIVLEMSSLKYCTLGAVFGIIFGLEIIDDMLGERKRATFDAIPDFKLWKGIVLFATGFAGGIFSAISGSGVDICSFSILCLLFRVSEKVATPTSIVLMAMNSGVGFFWRGMMSWSPILDEAWEYYLASIPIVVIFAPLGSFLSSHFHRQVLASMIYILDTLSLIMAFIVIPMTWIRVSLCLGIIIGGLGLFFILSSLGTKLAKCYTKKTSEEEENVILRVENSAAEV